MQRDLTHCRFYSIIDLGYVSKADVHRIAEQVVEGGADIVQLRGKKHSIDELADVAAGLLTITAPASIPLIVNDHAEIARRIQVDGVHVGQDDALVATVRGQLDRDVIVGKSTHTLQQALAAEEEGADYIGFGPIFATPTKPDYPAIGLGAIRETHERVSIPIFCIGGINLDNLQSVIDAGAKRVVMVSAVLRAHNIIDYVRCATDMLA